MHWISLPFLTSQTPHRSPTVVREGDDPNLSVGDLEVSEVIDSSSVDLRLLNGVTLAGRVSSSSPEASRSAAATLLSQLCLHLVTTGSSLLLKSKERNEKTRLYDFYLCLPESSCSGLVLNRVANGEEVSSELRGARRAKRRSAANI